MKARAGKGSNVHPASRSDGYTEIAVVQAAGTGRTAASRGHWRAADLVRAEAADARRRPGSGRSTRCLSLSGRGAHLPRSAGGLLSETIRMAPTRRAGGSGESWMVEVHHATHAGHLRRGDVSNRLESMRTRNASILYWARPGARADGAGWAPYSASRARAVTGTGLYLKPWLAALGGDRGPGLRTAGCCLGLDADVNDPFQGLR